MVKGDVNQLFFDLAQKLIKDQEKIAWGKTTGEFENEINTLKSYIPQLDKNAKDSVGDNPLYYAVQLLRNDIIQDFINNGWDINAPVTNDNRTPLIVIAGINRNLKENKTRDSYVARVMNFLLDRGANVNAIDTYKKTTAFWRTVLYPNFDAFEVLLERGADPTIGKGEYDSQLLSFLIKQFQNLFKYEANLSEYQKALATFLSFDFNVDLEDKFGKNLLQQLVSKLFIIDWQKPLLKQILDYILKKNDLLLNKKMAIDGQTPLMIAINQNNVSMAELLLSEKYINLDLKNDKKQSALDLLNASSLLNAPDKEKLRKLIEAKMWKPKVSLSDVQQHLRNLQQELQQLLSTIK